MIFNNLVSAASYIALQLIGLMPTPDYELLDFLGPLSGQIRTYMTNANYWLPVDTIAQFLALFIIVETTMLTWRATRWVLSILSVGIVK